MLSAVYGIKQIATSGVDPTACAAVGAGIVLGAAFLRRQGRCPAPWLDAATLHRRSVVLPLATNALGFFVLYATSYLLTQYLQLVLGLPPLQAGLWTIPSSLAWLLGSALAPALAARLGPAAALGGSVLVAAAGVTVLALPVPDARLAVVVVGSVVFSVGLAPAYVLSTELATSAASPERAGATSGLLETSAELGGALGIALLGSLGGAVYRAGLLGTPGAGAAELTQARESLAGALSAAGRLPGPAAGDLALQARSAFADGLRVAEVTGAALLAVLGVTLLVLLRGEDRDGDRRP